MSEIPKCAQCGKDAIGVQSFGCRTEFVCEVHAHSILRALGPGRRYSSGDCSFGRFDGSDALPDGGSSLPADSG